MHEKDRDLNLKIQDYLGGIGYVSNRYKNLTTESRVSTIKELTNVIIPHFDNYPLLTKKFSTICFLKKLLS
jgi:hypothetical protein